MEGTETELGPDGEPYFALPPKRKRPVWPWVVSAIVVFLVLALYAGFRAANVWDGIDPPGPPTPIETFEPRFPSEALVEGLLDEPVELERPKRLARSGAWWHKFLAMLPDPEGTPSILWGNEGTYEWLGADLEPHGTFRTENPLKALIHTGAAKAPYVSITTRAGAKGSETVDGRTGNGDRVWTWTGEDAPSVKAIAPLFDAEADGCVVGADGKEGVLGLSADGGVRWHWRERSPIYGVRTHRALPGWVLRIGGYTSLQRHDAPEPIERAGDRGLNAVFGDEFTFAHHGALFPTERGTPGVLWAGQGKIDGVDEPRLARIDAGDRSPAVDGAGVVWRMRPPAKVAALAMVEPPGRSRLFAVTTNGGELLVVDEDGALRARVRMPKTSTEFVVATYTLDAGPLGKDGWAIVVRLLKSTWVYRVHPEKLPAK
jgi:hypothetical protein